MKINIFKVLLSFFILSLPTYAIEITKESKKINITPLSTFLIDKDNLTKQEIENRVFKQIDSKSLTFGYNPDKTLWIKFKLTNKTKSPIRKIIEYHALSEKITFYDKNKTISFNMSNEDGKREYLLPYFEVLLNPYESRVFFIEISSMFTPLVAKLFLWDKDEFIKKSIRYTYTILIVPLILLFLFFYNFMIFLFTKDKAYLYYILYLLSIIFLYTTYTGALQFFLLSNEKSLLLMQYLPLATAFLAITMIMFVRTFLQTHQFSKIDKALKFYLYFTPIMAILASEYTFFRSNMMIFFIPLIILLIFVGAYSYYKGVKEALFYLLGWSFVLFALSTVILNNLGIFDITLYISYINSKAFLLETFLFSIALAHKIKLLNEENQKKQQALINFEQNEQKRLQQTVLQKTKDINLLLKEKELLYKELSHRIKNNLQMIISLLKLQISQTSLDETKNALITTKNRINSFAHLYEFLHQKSNYTINTKNYFANIVQTIQSNTSKDIEIIYDIRYDLKPNKLLYVGLILNELVTNAFKYAFKNYGKLHIKLYKEKNQINLIISDNAQNFNPIDQNGLGLTIVQALVKDQLHGKIDIKFDQGTTINISWKENE